MLKKSNEEKRTEEIKQADAEKVTQAKDELGDNWCLGRATVESPIELFDKKLNPIPKNYIRISPYMTYEKAKELQTKQNSCYRENQATNKPIILLNKY